MGLYHKDLGFPAKFYRNFPESVTLQLNHSRHAQQAAGDDGINLPGILEINKEDIFELETDFMGKTKKICVRTQYNRDYDLCLAISVDGTIITCWLNAAGDNHSTLNMSRYDRP